MAQSASRGGADPARQMADILAQFAERMGDVGKASVGLAGAGAADPMAMWRQLLSQPSIPLAQLRATLDDLAARREQIHSLVVQLQAFDQQLAALETSLRPLVEWSAAWDRLRQAILEPLAGTPGQTSPEETT
jgi:hypothetical protein